MESGADSGHFGLRAAITLIAASAVNVSANNLFDAEKCLPYVLAGGDDYELVFTAPPSVRQKVADAATQADTRVTRIGQIEARSAQASVRLVNAHGAPVLHTFAGFDHFI